MSKYEQFKMRLEEVEDILIKSGFNNSLRFKSQDLQKVCYLILKFSKIEKNNSISHIELIAMNVWEALRLIVGSIAGSTFFLLDYIFNWRRFSIKEVGLIKAGSKVDRFKGKSDYVFKSFSFFELSYLTPSNLLAAIRSFFKRDVCYIPVYHLTVGGLLSVYNYIFKYRNYLIGEFPKSNKYQRFLIDWYLIKLLLYRFWADSYAQVIIKKYKAKVWLFDIDQDGKFQLLADALNKLNQITVLLQHGIITNPFTYLPTCNHMLCSSEREKRILMEVGIESERIRVVGGPIQTIIPEKFKLAPLKFRNKFLVIASGQVSVEDTVTFIQIINAANYRTDKMIVRLHPRSTSEIDRLWKEGFDNMVFNNSQEILEQIQNSEIVITCSLDALIKCVYLNKPTICVLTKEKLESKEYLFLKEVSGLLVSIDLTSHQDNVRLITERNYHPNFSIDQLVSVFGENDINKVSKNISCVLRNIIEAE